MTHEPSYADHEACDKILDALNPVEIGKWRERITAILTEHRHMSLAAYRAGEIARTVEVQPIPQHVSDMAAIMEQIRRDLESIVGVNLATSVMENAAEAMRRQHEQFVEETYGLPLPAFDPMIDDPVRYANAAPRPPGEIAGFWLDEAHKIDLMDTSSPLKNCEPMPSPDHGIVTGSKGRWKDGAAAFSKRPGKRARRRQKGKR